MRMEQVVTLVARHSMLGDSYYIQQAQYSQLATYGSVNMFRLEVLKSLVLAMAEQTGEDPMLILQSAPYKERQQSAIIEAEKAAERMRKWMDA